MAIILGIVTVALGATKMGMDASAQKKASTNALAASSADATTRANGEQEEMVAGMIDSKMNASKASQGANQQLLEAMGYSESAPA